MQLITPNKFRFLKIFTTGTLIVGMYCHLSRLVFGIDNLLRYLLTPSFEGFFSIIIMIGATLQLIFIKQIAHKNIVEKIVYGFCCFQFVASVPLHIYAFAMQDCSYVRFFPPQYSVFTTVMWTYFIYVFAGLKMKEKSIGAIL